jgi:hypothetical protein
MEYLRIETPEPSLKVRRQAPLASHVKSLDIGMVILRLAAAGGKHRLMRGRQATGKSGRNARFVGPRTIFRLDGMGGFC